MAQFVLVTRQSKTILGYPNIGGVMKMLITWLLGVPVAVTFLFAVFAVDASKISPQVEAAQATESIAISPPERIAKSDKS